MKTKVHVRLQAVEWVTVEVEHEEDEDPTDLTDDDYEAAVRKASPFPDWEVTSVRPT